MSDWMYGRVCASLSASLSFPLSLPVFISPSLYLGVLLSEQGVEVWKKYKLGKGLVSE